VDDISWPGGRVAAFIVCVTILKMTCSVTSVWLSDVGSHVTTLEVGLNGAKYL